MPRYCLVVFSSREDDSVLHGNLLESAAAAPADTAVVLLINGNPELVARMHRRLAATPPAGRTSLWQIAYGDKANAWNQYVHSIWNGEDLAFFVDGYVTVLPGSIASLAMAVDAGGDHVLGGSGVPTIGRTAGPLREQMLKSGGFHGNFCCLKGSTIADMRRRGLRLPAGLYRTDALMGALLSFGLHPESCPWDPSHVAISSDAIWRLPPKKWWSWDDVTGQLKRLLRQGRGRIENAAVRYFLATCRLRFEDLPPTARALARSWRAEAPEEVAALLRASVLNRRGYRLLMEQSDASPEAMTPRLVWRNG